MRPSRKLRDTTQRPQEVEKAQIGTNGHVRDYTRQNVIDTVEEGGHQVRSLQNEWCWAHSLYLKPCLMSSSLAPYLPESKEMRESLHRYGSTWPSVYQNWVGDSIAYDKGSVRSEMVQRPCAGEHASLEG
jgi:hypothetical protein